MIEVMKIVNTHGVKGELKALYYADSPEFFKKVKILFDNKGKEYKITDAREYKGALLVSIDGVTDMTNAEKLKGLTLYARREDLPELPEGEYYLTDLIGLTAVTDAGDELGKIENIIEKPAQNLLLIRSGEREVLIPHCKPFVKETDVEKGIMIIEPIEGLI